MFNPETKISPQMLIVLIGFYNVWHYVLFEHKTFADIAEILYCNTQLFLIWKSHMTCTSTCRSEGDLSTYQLFMQEEGNKAICLLSICS